MAKRILVHCDLDAFFASVETIHHHLDENKPLIIGSDPQNGRGRGIVSTCNYAARKFGVRSAMPISEAWRRCPGPPMGTAIYMQGTRGLYTRASRKVMQILQTVGGPFEKASIDEAYMDVTEAVEGNWDQAIKRCADLQQEIENRLGLTASFGIGQTRILAKMGSEVNKPNGIHRTLPDEIESFLAPRSLRDIPGIGPKTSTKLAEWGIETIGDAMQEGVLTIGRHVSERFAEWLFQVIEGESSNDVSLLRSRKSIGKETTFPQDLMDEEIVLERLNSLVTKVMEKARKEGISGRLAEVKIRYKGFETHSYGKSIPVAMDDVDVFLRLSRQLFAHFVQSGRPIRLIGFRLGNLFHSSNKQTTLDNILEAKFEEE